MALQDRFAGDDPGRFAWWTWPEECRAPTGPGVERFRQENPDRIEFHAYLQWIDDGQLRRAAEAGRAAGLRIELYRDIAVGVGPASAARSEARRVGKECVSTWRHRGTPDHDKNQYKIQSIAYNTRANH